MPAEFTQIAEFQAAPARKVASPGRAAARRPASVSRCARKNRPRQRGLCAIRRRILLWGIIPVKGKMARDAARTSEVRPLND